MIDYKISKQEIPNNCAQYSIDKYLDGECIYKIGIHPGQYTSSTDYKLCDELMRMINEQDCYTELFGTFKLEQHPSEIIRFCVSIYENKGQPRYMLCAVRIDDKDFKEFDEFRSWWFDLYKIKGYKPVPDYDYVDDNIYKNIFPNIDKLIIKED